MRSLPAKPSSADDKASTGVGVSGESTATRAKAAEVPAEEMGIRRRSRLARHVLDGLEKTMLLVSRGSRTQTSVAKFIERVFQTGSDASVR